jgi:RNA polymerase sigma factor (sigma-70 family)
MTELTDADLIERCRTGDKSAYGVLVERYQLRLRRVLAAVLSYPTEVDDVAQEAFLEAYLSLDKLRQPERFRAWLCGIGLNLAKMRLRRMKWLVELDTAVSLPAPQPTPEQITEQHEGEQRLYAAISDLPPAEREALLLVYRDGFSHQETAVQLGISLSAVKVRVHRGRNRLRSALTPVEVHMLEVAIHDILTIKVDPNADLPDDEAVETMEKAELDALWRSLNEHRIVILKEKMQDRYLPIWIGPSEADLLLFKLQEKELKRPLVFDLTRTLMDLGSLTLEKVAVSRLHGQVFYGSLTIRKNGTTHEVDCRPSDAINLAVRQDVPMFVAAEVMEQAGELPNESGVYRFKGSKARAGASWQSLLLGGEGEFDESE